MPDSFWLPLTARECFLARQDRWRGTLVLTSTLWDSIRPELERRRAAAFRTCPVWFRAGIPLRVRRLFFQALVVSILYTGLKSLRLRSSDYEYLDRFILGLERKMMRGKATITTKLEDGTEKKRTVDRRNVWDFLSLVPSGTELHARRLQWYQNLMKDPTAHQNVLFSFFGEASFESDTIFDEGDRIRESSCGGSRQWQEDVDGLGVFDDGAVFLERGGVGQWFLDSGLRQDFGILDMNGIRAAYRAVKIPPPCCLGGPPALIPPETEQEDLAPERPHVCPECNDSFETLRQLVADQTHKRGYRHPPGIVTVTNTCVWCRNIYRDRRATYLHHQQSWKRGYCRGRGCHLHTVVIPVNTPTVINISNQSPCCLIICEQFFLWKGMQNWVLTQSSGTSEARPQRTKRPRGAQEQANPDTQKQMLLILSRLALKHDLEIRELQAATFRNLLVKQDEPLMLASEGATGLFVANSKEGQRPPGEPHVYGWAAMMTAMTTDPALSAEDKQKVVTYTSTANSPETLLQSIYWSLFKKHFRRTGPSGSVQWTPRLSPSCASSSKP